MTLNLDFHVFTGAVNHISFTHPKHSKTEAHSVPLNELQLISFQQVAKATFLIIVQFNLKF